MITNPEEEIILSIEQSLANLLESLKLKGKAIVQEVSKKSSFGDYCTPIFQIAGQNRKNPNELANLIAENFPKNEFLVEVSAEGGFVNYTLNRSKVSKAILSSILEEEDFHLNQTYKGKKIIVEHTSANPNGPIHIGNFRGSIIGDVYAKILKACGAEVYTNFYVDDLGHQVPVCAIGYDLYKRYNKVPSSEKIDHFLGRIYGITHTMYDIQKFKADLLEKYNFNLGKDKNWVYTKEITELKNYLEENSISEKEGEELTKRLDFLFRIQNDIYKRFKELYDKLKESIEKEKIDLPTIVPDLNRRYMIKENEAFDIIRGTCKDALKGQTQELATLGISHDFYDWEADLQWSGKVDDVLEKLEKNGYLIKDNLAKIFDANKAANIKGAREYLKLKTNYEVPKGILITSTGDTLYLLRDIAYSLKKVDFYKSDKVFNVIGKPQELAQIQLNLATRALGREDVANKMWHLNYEYMELKGALTSMSARRLQYITPLELYNQTKEAVYENFLKERDYPEEEKEDIAKKITVGAIKYSIIAVGLMRKLTFDPQEVISLSNNTSAFIQYAYARSQNILAKTEFSWDSKKSKFLEVLQEEEEWSLVLSLAKLPQIIVSAADQIKPELICNYLFDIATLFNKFYDNHRVLDASTKELITARLALTYCVGLVLTKGLNLLGIESPSRM